MTALYTRGGDNGSTSTPGSGRISKADLRLEALGTIDELGAVVGLAHSLAGPSEHLQILRSVQEKLIALAAEVAAGGSSASFVKQRIVEADTKELELAIDSCQELLPELRSFVLANGVPAAAALHFARTVCRRAERRIVDLHERSQLSPAVLKYINRLSDLLFVLARLVNHEAQDNEAERR
ncbi:MAG: cob(I)yrinic acid a,c-diamide adenosyltransferase [Chloroflexi bacterium]|nr:MAG: cob(I)yrinic acid a,c-diamide adenosyltransferase [Chloroflexota bacterium]